MTNNVLITGAANRIGAAMASSLAGAGYSVIVHFNSSRAEAENLCADIQNAGGKAKPIQADLTDQQQRRSLIDNAKEPFGRLSALINNASVYEYDSATTLGEDLWDRHFEIHTKAPMFLSQDFAAQLPFDSNGNIINIIDERVLRLHPEFFSYNLSKSALWTATKTLAQALAPKIRVNAIGPGPTLPNPRQSQDQFEKSIQKLPLQTAANPTDIAKAALFLLQTPSMTGQMLALDGGEHLEWRGRGEAFPEVR